MRSRSQNSLAKKAFLDMFPQLCLAVTVLFSTVEVFSDEDPTPLSWTPWSSRLSPSAVIRSEMSLSSFSSSIVVDDVIVFDALTTFLPLSSSDTDRRTSTRFDLKLDKFWKKMPNSLDQITSSADRAVQLWHCCTAVIQFHPPLSESMTHHSGDSNPGPVGNLRERPIKITIGKR